MFTAVRDPDQRIFSAAAAAPNKIGSGPAVDITLPAAAALRVDVRLLQNSRSLFVNEQFSLLS